MKIQHIKISNILGIEHFEFSPAGFTAITGPNGAGKSSILEAIKSATQQGHDATLLRKGSDQGEVVLVLDDGTEIQERVSATRTTRDVVRDGKKITQPGNVIKALTDVLSVNPVEFLTARKQDRVKVLLEAMPIELDVAKLSEISGIPVQVAPGIHALHTIEIVRQQVYDDRTGTNRAVKEKDATINQLRAAMPEAPEGVTGDESELEAKLAAANEALTLEKQRIDTKLAGLRAESEAKIAALRQQIEDEKAAFAQIEVKAGAQRTRVLEKYHADAAPINAALSGLRANRDAAAKRKVTAETIEKMRQELTELEGDAKRQTAALEAIDKYKSDLLAALPIPGVEVRDGEVYRDGIPFDRLNTAQRVGIAFEIAKLRAGELAIVCLDGMELLDDDSLAEMQRRAAEDDLQVFLTRVNKGEFCVNTQ